MRRAVEISDRHLWCQWVGACKCSSNFSLVEPYCAYGKYWGQCCSCSKYAVGPTPCLSLSFPCVNLNRNIGVVYSPRVGKKQFVGDYMVGGSRSSAVPHVPDFQSSMWHQDWEANVMRIWSRWVSHSPDKWSGTMAARLVLPWATDEESSRIGSELELVKCRALKGGKGMGVPVWYTTNTAPVSLWHKCDKPMLEDVVGHTIAARGLLSMRYKTQATKHHLQYKKEGLSKGP